MKIGFVMCTGLCVASASSAANLTLTFNGYSLSGFNSIAYVTNRAWDFTGATNFYNINCGIHNFTSGSGRSVDSFCAQLFEGVTPGNTYVFAEVAPSQVPDEPGYPGNMGVVKATIVQDLYKRYYNGIDTAIEASAFQLALYEVTHENLTGATAAAAVVQLNLAAGAFSASQVGSAAYSDAAAMLASLGSGGFGSIGNNLVGLTNPSAQDQLVVVPIGAPAILAGLGLLGVGLLRRRK